MDETTYTTEDMKRDAHILLGIARGIARWIEQRPEHMKSVLYHLEKGQIYYRMTLEIYFDVQASHWLHETPKIFGGKQEFVRGAGWMGTCLLAYLILFPEYRDILPKHCPFDLELAQAVLALHDGVI
jgi:hypothetical protein